MAEQIWLGLDAGVDYFRLCAIDTSAVTVFEETVVTDASEARRALSALDEYRIVQIAAEAGSAGMHMLRSLMAEGFPLVFYETRQVSKYLRIRNNKTDRNDARGLAEIARFGIRSVSKVHLKNPDIQRLRSQLNFRHKLMLQRVACEGMIRSMLRMHGGSMKRASSAKIIDRNVRAALRRIMDESKIDLSDEILPLLSLCVSMRQVVEQYEKKLSQWAAQDPVCSRFMEIPGVGPICAISFYTAVAEPERFKRASDVGPYLGMTPRVLQSGHSLRHGHISKMGNRLTRSHLTMAAGTLLHPKVPNSGLKAWGKALGERAGTGKARVAVARKLAVLMLALWKSGASYDPQFGVK